MLFRSGSLAGALWAARRTVITIAMVSWSALAFGVAMGLFAVAPGQPIAFAFALLVGLSSITFMTTSTAIVQIRANPTMRGRVLALQAIVFLGSTPIGGPIVGLICQQFGARYGLALGALGALGAGVWGLLFVRRSQVDAPRASGSGDPRLALAATSRG